jgi:predicted metalloprotease with PDZ domain
MKTIQLWLFLTIFNQLSTTLFAQNQPPGAKANIIYSISTPNPQTHYVEVEMQLTAIEDLTAKSNGYLDFKMPVWTPGSYLIREYAKNVEAFEAKDNSSKISSKKINKNTWRVKYNGQSDITVNYKVYAFELSVRTSFVDDSHAYLNGASIFMYNPQFKNNQSVLKINLNPKFSQITTGLQKNSGNNVFQVIDFDNLVDCPIEIGNQKILSFDLNGIPHQIAMYGQTNYNEEKLKSDMQKVCSTAASVIGEHPCKDYFFIVHNVTQGGGGLEHKNSTTLGVNRNAYQSDQTYKSFLSLVAHEYFHLWNVKRIRPVALGPFDYENENYTNGLWVSEGFTSYYQNHILQKAGLISEQQYLTMLEKEWASLENTPGQKIQSVAESSWDAWIKYYRQNENSKNTIVSYYDKGSALGALMDLYIIDKTNGKKCLDDVMRLLYSKYYKELGRGFSDLELKNAFNEISSADMTSFFEKYIEGTDQLPFAELLKNVGLKFNEVYSAEAYLGAEVRITDGKIIVSSVSRDSPAYLDGISVNDELLSIDNFRLSPLPDALSKIVQSKKVGETINVTVIRDGMLRSMPIVLKANPFKSIKLEKQATITKDQEVRFKKWLRTQATQ